MTTANSDGFRAAANPRLNEAASCAAQGLPVFPVYWIDGAGRCTCGAEQCAAGKHPMTPRGHNDASTDPGQIGKWWAIAPDANVGIAVPDSFVVVDVDPRNGGEATLEALERAHGELPQTRTASTGGGGAHFWFRVPLGWALPSTLGAGVDVKQLGGYVLAPPSNHASGRRYEWASSPDAPIVVAPEWMIARGHPRGERKAIVVDELDERTADGATLDQIVALVAPHYVDGKKHHVAKSLGGWLKQRGFRAGDVAYIVGRLPSTNPAERVKAAVAAFGFEKAFGWGELKELVGDAAAAELETRTPNPKREAERAATSEIMGPTLERLQAANDAPARDDKRTDLGNARRLVRLHGVNLRYFPARALWYAWDGTRWAPDETGEVVRLAKAAAEALWEDARGAPDDKRADAFKWAAKCQERSRIENMIALAKTEPGIAVTARDLDSDPWLLNVANGVLDLRTGQLHAADRALLMTKRAPVAYSPDARSALWDSFVWRLTGGDAELGAYIQRAMGYALFGAWREKAFWFGYGPPDGGKSTFLGVVGDVLGDYHVSAAASTWMFQHNAGGNRGDVTRLLGTRLVTTLEVRPSARFDPELMKKATGGDSLVAAAKFEHEIEFRPAFALWFGANDRPIIPDDDEGFWSRVRCVPFTHVIPPAEQDKALREKLTSAEHAPGVLAWLVAGCLAWQREGIGTCAAVEAATRAYRRDMNQAAGFFDEHCELTGNPGDVVPAAQLRARYDAWCKVNGVRRPLQTAAWRKRLLELGVTGGDDASRVGGHRVWSGIRLRPEGGQ
jgi:putative DNA primase/helicase